MAYPIASLLDICENRTSGIPSFDGEKQYLSTGDLDFDKVISTETITYDNRPSRANRALKYDDVICARMQNTIKALHIDNEKLSDLIVSTGFVVLHPKEGLLPKYLKYFLLSSRFNIKKDSLCNGATQKAINDTNLRKIKIVLPPLSEQKRIVEILEKSDRLRRKRQEADGVMKKSLMSFALDIFGDPARNPKKWETRKFCEIALLERGRFGYRPRNEPRFYGGKYPFIQINDITKSGMVIREYSQTLNEKGLAISKLFPASTVVVSIASTIGEVGILGFDSCFPDSLVGITPKEGVVTKEYIYFYLIYMKSHLNKIAPQLAQKNINLKILNNLSVSVPPISEQQKFADLVQKVEKIKEKQRESKKELDNLFNSLMQKVFG